MTLSALARKRISAMLVLLVIASLQQSIASSQTASPGTATAPFDGQHVYPTLPYEGSSVGTGFGSAQATASRLTGEVAATATAQSATAWGCTQPTASSTGEVRQLCDQIVTETTTPTATTIPAGIILTTPLGATGPTIGIGGSSGFAYGEVGHTFVGVPAGSHAVTVSLANLITSKSAFPAGRDRIDKLSGAFTQADAIVEYYPCVKNCAYTFVQRISVELPNGLIDGSIDLISKTFTSPASGGRVYVRAGLIARAMARGPSGDSSAVCSGRVASISVS